MTTEKPDFGELAIEILRATSDGDDLSSRDLALVQAAVNDNLSPQGEEIFLDLHARASSGKYQRPWHFDVEHVTKCPEAYIYWKGKQIEHFTYRGDTEKEKEATVRLGEACLAVEAEGLPVNFTNYCSFLDRLHPQQ